LQAQAKRLLLDNIKFLPHIPRPSLPAWFSQMDALFISLKPESLFRFGVSPNKLMDYMMAGKPVISVIQAGNDIVAEARCGITSETKPEHIARAVGEMLLLPAEERRKMGMRGKEYVIAHHDYRLLARQFLDVMMK
jgi:glycosyltransferase involved in cell wall biosynthesis